VPWCLPLAWYDCRCCAARSTGAPGVEFVLQDAQAPHLFVIRKQLRALAGDLTSLAYYYVLDGTVYQAPTLHAVLSARIVSRPACAVAAALHFWARSLGNLWVAVLCMCRSGA
jgi:mediator of RNA polymerase II transcription subunit 6